MDSIELIRDFLEQRLGAAPEKVTPEARLEELGIDSLMMLELMFEFEEKLGIALDKTLQTPKTVGEMAGMMEQLRKANG
jgi:acyl carrier protein